MKRFAACLLALAVIPMAAACGSDDSSTKSTASSVQETAAQAPPSTPPLGASEQRTLTNAKKAFTDYCATKKEEPVGSVALAESLLDFGADVKTADGTTLGEELAKSRDELKRCGATKLAKRLSAALQAK